MEIQLNISEYSPETGIILNWKSNFMISTEVSKAGIIVLNANTDGLISLATHLLTLAQPTVPKGSHIHYDAGNELELESKGLTIVKAPDL